MIKEKTLFVLGAGASRPYVYPTGKELRHQIISRFVGRYSASVLRGEKSHIVKETSSRKVKHFCETFLKSSNKSIDLFLSRNPSFAGYGILAILIMILDAELRSKFREDMDDVNQDWYSYLFDRMTADFIQEGQYHIAENNISFITFNYDRSLEHFIHESLGNSFTSVNTTEIINEVKKIRIVHIYGKVADLKWQNHGEGIPYRTKPNQIWIPDLSKNIKVIYDETSDPTIDEARQLLMNADRIFFLGFGYAEENMKLLNFPGVVKPGQKVYGTAKGLSGKEISDVKDSYFVRDDTEPSDIIIDEVDCITLLRKYL